MGATPSIIDAFGASVIQPFRVAVPGKPTPLTYEEYLGEAASSRLNDEATAVDQPFSLSLLGWLGWTTGDWRYNRPEAGAGKTVQRPDYRVVSEGATAFIVEDKASGLDWHPEYLTQMRKYATGTAGYALWTNARTLTLFRFYGDGAFDTLASASVEDLYGPQRALHNDDVAAIELIHDLLGRQRFTSFAGYVEAACKDDPRVPLDTNAALGEFITASHSVLDSAGRAAAAQLRAALASVSRRREHEMEIAEDLGRLTGDLFTYALTETQRIAAEQLASRAAVGLGSLTLDDISDRPSGLGAAQKRAFDAWAEAVLKLDSRRRLIDWEGQTHGRLEDAFSIWLRQQPDQDPARATVERFSEQVAYVLFVRLMLIRILEDREIITPRILSNGGFDSWRALVSEQFSPRGASALTDVHGGPFLTILFTTVGSYYRHFFQQPIFDWYQPDDLTLVRLLAHLNRYDFQDITDDVIGFTYEHYVDRRGKREKGQFLTRSGLVNYTLRRAGYQGASVIGKRVLDHACGSGSFLIHAVRELRSALIERTVGLSAGAITTEDLTRGNGESRKQFAKELLDYVASDLVGMDIDPFACYLAELNLLVQLLDEMTLRWEVSADDTLERFLIFNADGLSLPDSVLHSSLSAPTVTDPGENPLDESWALKGLKPPFENGFDFIVANPPYVTPKKQESLSSAPEYPFFQDVLDGDMNLYLLFIRLVEHYLADDGRAALIVPLGLTGDDSARAARRLLTTGRLRLRNLSRFYSGTVLFPEVDQWVMVFGIEAGAPDRDGTDVELRGGINEQTAENAWITVPHASVVNVEPSASQTEMASPWRGPWLNVADQAAFDVWEHVCSVAVGYVDALITDFTEARQGDVNTTKVKNLVRDAPGPRRLARYQGGQAQPFAPLPDPDQWVEGPDTDPEKEPGETLFRVAALTTQESGFVMQVQANLHIARRLRATWFARGPGDTKVFVHSLWRFVAQDSKETETKALMGLFSSALMNYLYGIWSTNFNIQLNVLRRLPVPSTESFPRDDVAAAVDKARDARDTIATLTAGGRGRFNDGVASIAFNLAALLRESGVRVVSLRTAELAGDIVRATTGSQKIENLLVDDRLQFADTAYTEAVTPLLAEAAKSQWSSEENTRMVPRKEDAAAWLAYVEEQRQAAVDATAAYRKAIADIDELVFDWYGLPNGELRDAVLSHLPWEYSRARAESVTAGVDADEAPGAESGDELPPLDGEAEELQTTD